MNSRIGSYKSERRVKLESGDQYEDHHKQMIAVDGSLIRQCDMDPLKKVVNAAYGEVNTVTTSQSYYTDRAILTPQNETDHLTYGRGFKRLLQL